MYFRVVQDLWLSLYSINCWCMNCNKHLFFFTRIAVDIISSFWYTANLKETIVTAFVNLRWFLCKMLVHRLECSPSLFAHSLFVISNTPHCFGEHFKLTCLIWFNNIHFKNVSFLTLQYLMCMSIHIMKLMNSEIIQIENLVNEKNKKLAICNILNFNGSWSLESVKVNFNLIQRRKWMKYWIWDPDYL